MTCRHCLQAPVNRPRGLCWPCYYTPGVRELYPITSKYALGGVGRGNGSRPLPEPTDAPPGTSAKAEVLIDRAAKEQALWHPDDNRESAARRWPEPGTPWTGTTAIRLVRVNRLCAKED